MNTATAWTIAIVALVIGVGLGYLWGGPYKTGTTSTSTAQMAGLPSNASVKLYTDMRKLWTDHVWWTREYITALAADNTPAANAAAARLMRNQEDIGAAIEQYYGMDAGDELTTLLKSHITIAVDLLNAAKAGNKTAFNRANTQWQQNADQIAFFLSQANPHWPQATLKEMMRKHLDTTLDEVNAELKEDRAGSVDAFNAVVDHIDEMSDTLAAGIIKQFPNEF